jgi:putative PIN family toxin of toxin-antitoxin system
VSDKLKVVFDTQIFLRALIKRTSFSAKIASEDWKGYYTLYFSDAIEGEITDVLNRPEIRSKFPQITDELVQGTLDDLRQAKRVNPDTVEAVSRDPKDDIFLACAKVAGANYLVSEDKDLLVLEQYHNTKIVGVGMFLSVLEALQNRPSEPTDE